MKKWIWIIPLLFVLTGCWNYRELTQLAITTGIALDKVEDEYQMTIMIANSQKQGSDSGEQKAATAVYSGKGKTMYEAIKDTSLSVSKQIYLGHIEVLVISEEIAKEDIKDVLDFLFRYPQTRNDFQLIMTKDCLAGDALKITIPLESFPSQNISKNLQETDRLQGTVYRVNFNDFVKTILEKGKQSVLPGISIIGNVEEGNKEENIKENQPQTYLKLGTMAVFKDDHFVSWTTLEESRGINIINNKVTIFGLVADYQDGKVVAEVNDMETKIDVIDVANKKYKISVKATAGIQELTGGVVLDNQKVIEEIQAKEAEVIKHYIEKALSFAKEQKTDIFGFGNLLYKRDPQAWKEVADQWDDEVFPTIEVEIEIDLHLQAKGTINDYSEVEE